MVERTVLDFHFKLNIFYNIEGQSNDLTAILYEPHL